MRLGALRRGNVDVRRINNVRLAVATDAQDAALDINAEDRLVRLSRSAAPFAVRPFGKSLKRGHAATLPNLALSRQHNRLTARGLKPLVETAFGLHREATKAVPKASPERLAQ